MGYIVKEGNLTIIHEDGEEFKIAAEAFDFETEAEKGSSNKFTHTYRQELSFEENKDSFELVVTVKEINDGLNGSPEIEAYPVGGGFTIEVDDSELNLGIEPS